MKRRLKGLGLAMLAVLAMGSVAAQGAQGATPGLLTAEAYPATLSGTQLNTHIFTLTGLGTAFECEVTKLSGSLASPGSSTVTVTPTYEKCKWFGQSLTYDVEGCDFLIHIGETSGSNYSGTTDIVCPVGKVIKLTSGIVGNRCEIQIGPQTGLGKVEGINKAGPPKDVELKLSLTGITYKVTKDEGVCALSKVGETFKDGDYSGNVTLTGSSGLSISD